MRLLAHDLDYLALGRLRRDVATGAAESALPGLEREIARALAENRLRRAMKLRVLRAIALRRAGREAAAVAAIGEVLEQAAPEGVMRLLLDEGPEAGALVLRHAQASAAGRHAASPIFAQYLERLLKGFGPLPSDDEETAAAAQPRDPLTRGETRVLQLLAEGYSNNAMAEKLFVSENTVRTHLRNINAKLGARSRTQAVAIGRRLGLVR
jgi:LuxR family maltose regulon positive regulatory protein